MTDATMIVAVPYRKFDTTGSDQAGRGQVQDRALIQVNEQVARCQHHDYREP